MFWLKTYITFKRSADCAPIVFGGCISSCTTWCLFSKKVLPSWTVPLVMILMKRYVFEIQNISPSLFLKSFARRKATFGTDLYRSLCHKSRLLLTGRLFFKTEAINRPTVSWQGFSATELRAVRFYLLHLARNPMYKIRALHIGCEAQTHVLFTPHPYKI